MSESIVTLLPTQAEVLACDAKQILVTGGLGGGKTAIGVHFVIKMITEYPKARGLICANTYKQLNNATITALIAELKRLGFKEDHHYTHKEGMITIEGSEIVTSSLEAYESLRGAEFGWAWVDEASFTKEEAYRTVVERVRQTLGPCQILLTTTTNGFNWLYERFVENATPDHILFKMRTKDNYFLRPTYYSDLIEQYGGPHTLLAKQQLDGEFVNLTSGAVYTYFDELSMSPNQYQGGKRYVACDFNVGNMNAVITEIDNGVVYVLDEIKLTGNAGTHELSKEIRLRYGTINVEIIPDATGKARKSSSTSTDHEIMRSYGFTVKSSSRNPYIADRQLELNTAFLKRLVVIDPKCKHLIAELRKLTNDDEEGKVAHLSPALGYLVYNLNIAGIRVKKSPTFKQYQL